MDSRKVIDTLNDLIEHCKDGEFNFRKAAEHANGAHVKQAFESRANDCQMAAEQLQNLVLQRDGNYADSGTLGGAARRGWINVKSALTGHKDLSLLEEIESGEDTALEAYREALDKGLPPDIHAVVAQQYEGVQRNHAQIRELRNQARLEKRD